MTITIITQSNCPQCQIARDNLCRRRISHTVVQSDVVDRAWRIEFVNCGGEAGTVKRTNPATWREAGASEAYSAMHFSGIQTFPVLVIDGVAHDFDDAMAILKEIQQ